MNSPRLRFLLPWAAVVLLSSPACISVPDIEPAKAEVRITSPEGVAYTNGVLEVRLEVTGHTPERVELLKDGEVLAEVAAPYVYAWDTAGVAEGTHQVVARAVFGDVTFASEAREVVVDRTAPTVVSRTPEQGAQDVWVKAPIQAVFSEPVKAGTLTQDSVRLTVGGVEVARTVSVAADGRTVTVVPGAGYEPSNPVSLTFSEQVVDLAGNRVEAPAEAWNWVVPYWIPWGSADGAPTTNHSDYVGSYAFDSSGTLIAVWHILGSPGRTLFVKRWEGGEWKIQGQTSIAGPIESSQINSESLILDSRDSPVIAWSQGTGPGSSRISIKRWSDNQWKSLGNHPGASPGLPQKLYLSLCPTLDGQPAITWSESSTTSTKICASHWDTDQWLPFGECFDAQAYSEDYANPVLRFTSDGVPMVSWLANRTSEFKIRTSKFTDTGWVTFGGDPVTDIQGPYVSMAIDNANIPVIAYLTFNGVDYSLSIEHWINQDWGVIGYVEPTVGTILSRGYSLQTDQSGTVFAAWSSTQPHVSRWNGMNWQPLDDISNAEPAGYTGSASLQRTNSGELVLTWFRTVGFDTRIRVRRLNH